MSDASLLALWQSNPGIVEEKTFAQLISFTGDGRLRDDSATSQQLRQFLAAQPLDTLQTYADECLDKGFPDSGLGLQDIVNELGTRLGFRAVPGRYKGTRNGIGFDGLWTATDGYELVIEVKTTDAYRINLDVVAKYREQLIDADSIAEESSILIVVGRQDTGDLEAQTRGSRHAWDIRIIGVEALFRLARVKEQMSDWATINRINRVLRPWEYTRVDDIITLIFETSKDIETDETPDKAPPETLGEPVASNSDDPAAREQARTIAVERVSKVLGLPFVRKGKVLRSSSNGEVNLVCLVSRRHDGPGGSSNYWYGFTPAQRKFVEDAAQGFIVFVCLDSGRVFMLDREEFLPWLPEMLTTPPPPVNEDDIRHWHIYFNDYGSRVEMMPRASEGQPKDISPSLLR